MVRHLRKDLVHILFHHLRRNNRVMEGFVGFVQRRDGSWNLQRMKSCMKVMGERVVCCKPYTVLGAGSC